MDRNLIPFLQAAIDNKSGFISDLTVNEYMFSFTHKNDKDCHVEVFFDTSCELVCMNQYYTGDEVFVGEELDIEQFIEYIS